VLPVPRADVQRTISVPWEDIALCTLLAPLVRHYRAGVDIYHSLKNLYLDFLFLQAISGLDIPELLVLKESLFD
jgi:hypothetical protein